MRRSCNTPEALLHLTHPTWTLWFISSPISPSCWIIDPKYLNFSLFRISWLAIFTISSFVFLFSLKLHFIYYVLVLLILKPLDSRTSLQTSNLAFTPDLVSSINTISYANNIYQELSSWICLVNSSITNAKRYGLINTHIQK